MMISELRQKGDAVNISDMRIIVFDFMEGVDYDNIEVPEFDEEGEAVDYVMYFLHEKTKDDMYLSTSMHFVLDRFIDMVRLWHEDDPTSMTAHITKYSYELWHKKCEGKYAISTLRRSFSRLQEQGIIKRVNRGIYMLNPYKMFVGSPRQVRRARVRWDELNVVDEIAKMQKEDDLPY